MNAAEFEEDQYLIKGGAEQVAQKLWRHAPEDTAYWPKGTSLSSLNHGAPRPAAKRIFRNDNGKLGVTDRWGRTETFFAAVATTQSWLLTTSIETEEQLFDHKVWMALDRTRYMQSSKPSSWSIGLFGETKTRKPAAMSCR